MVKSTIKLENGTVITVEGSVEEVSRLMSVYGKPNGGTVSGDQKVSAPPKKKEVASDNPDGKIDTISLVNATKDADDYEQIEKNIFDKASQVDRVLLPIFIAERKFGNDATLTSNDVYKFLKEFGINMALPNISKTLSGPAKNYVMGDSVRKKGASTSYRISRKGKQYIEQILSK
jgi:hypothetical protein